MVANDESTVLDRYGPKRTTRTRKEGPDLSTEVSDEVRDNGDPVYLCKTSIFAKGIDTTRGSVGVAAEEGQVDPKYPLYLGTATSPTIRPTARFDRLITTRLGVNVLYGLGVGFGVWG